MPESMTATPMPLPVIPLKFPDLPAAFQSWLAPVDCAVTPLIPTTRSSCGKRRDLVVEREQTDLIRRPAQDGSRPETLLDPHPVRRGQAVHLRLGPFVHDIQPGGARRNLVLETS